ncbi:MAG: plasmid pRiA4b ORF-3 family protein [Treponema sp.]|jgi:hypothetical protein|nr:plasmid pRiA4b ORF-3 family protein [Treponema sp.]
MTYIQEDALYDFLDEAVAPFKLEELVSHIYIADKSMKYHLADEALAFLDSRHLAFKTSDKKWVSRRACFESAPFVIRPSRLELLNGILIPGHRCIPFANPELLPQEYTFFWKGAELPFTSTQGEPEEFYPYYSIYGEEYAPQYVARDNPENEQAFISYPYEDPPEVSIQTLDMRNVYREAPFVPGDIFVVRTVDWSRGVFSLERAAKDEWAGEDIASWLLAAESGFEDSFRLMGPLSSTEEQIAYAYWYGGKRMRELPAYSLEDFLYEKTERVETAAYGIETRFWYAGREIPDRRGLDKSQARPDRTEIEEFLWKKDIPISEYIVQSYIRDFIFRRDKNISLLIDRIVPPCIGVSPDERLRLEEYIAGAIAEFSKTYSPFTGRSMDPIRQRIGELHTAVIELAAKLGKSEIDTSWLPKHTFIILSQIQNHTAGIMEDLDIDEQPPDEELDAIDNSLDSMIDTYEDLRLLIDEALESFRRNKLSIVHSGGRNFRERLIQFSIGGTDIWRRVLAGESCCLEDLHRIIQAIFSWKNSQIHRFSADKVYDTNPSIKELCGDGVVELSYEYGTKWTVNIMILSRYEIDAERPVRCVAGAGAAPPEVVGGPLRFRRFVSALEGKNESERRGAEKELGLSFKAHDFDLESCNSILQSNLNMYKRPGQNL